MNLTILNYQRHVKKCNMKKNVSIADKQDIGLTKGKISLFSTLLLRTILNLGTKALSITILSSLGRVREMLGLFRRNSFKLNLLIAQSHHDKQPNRSQEVD